MGTVAGLLTEEHHLRPPPSPGCMYISYIILSTNPDRSPTIVASTSVINPLARPETPHHPRRPSVSSRQSSRSVLYYDPQLHSSLPSNTTENIIEALFNPFPSTVQSPFTVPMPPRGPSQVDFSRSRSEALPQLQLSSAHDDADSISIGESSSSHTTSTASTRRSSQTSGSWWKRLGGSRPPTPSVRSSSPLRQKRPSLGSRSELGVH